MKRTNSKCTKEKEPTHPSPLSTHTEGQITVLSSMYLRPFLGSLYLVNICEVNLAERVNQSTFCRYKIKLLHTCLDIKAKTCLEKIRIS